MKGKILDYTVQTNEGIISGDDGNRYKFSGTEWKAATPPMAGACVDFEVSDQTAHGVYLVSGAASSGNQKRVVAAILALFLGVFGVHKFYLGMTTPAVIMLCAWLFGWILGGIPSFVIWVVAIIEFVIYLTKSDADFEQTYVVGRKEWF